MERPDWDNYFMRIAHVVKTRSLDPKTQVGAVLVSMRDHRIISTGYNSLKAGVDNNGIDWNNRDLVHDVIIHAETNAILYAQSKFEDSVLYTTMSPCHSCVKLLSATQIRKIVYDTEYRDIDKVKKLCSFFGIELVKVS